MTKEKLIEVGVLLQQAAENYKKAYREYFNVSSTVIYIEDKNDGTGVFITDSYNTQLLKDFSTCKEQTTWAGN